MLGEVYSVYVLIFAIGYGLIASKVPEARIKGQGVVCKIVIFIGAIVSVGLRYKAI